MGDKIPVYLEGEEITMLYEKITKEFSASGYEGAKTLVSICEAFKEALERFIAEE
jgi:hypothetical protein